MKQATDIHITRTDDIADLSTCQELQRQVWGMDDNSIVPIHLLRAIVSHGGFVLIARDAAGAPIGFNLTLLGEHAGQLAYLSHMTGVLPAYQGRAIGRQIKLRQREIALDRGFQLVVWTFDPMQRANCAFNLAILGAIVREYHPDYYGELADGINAGLPTDRFTAEWWVNSPHVERRLLRTERPTPRQLEAGRAEPVLSIEHKNSGTAVGEWRAHLSAPYLLLEIPARLEVLKNTEPETARRWQQGVRAACQHYLARGGYAVTDFVVDEAGETQRAFQVLQRDFDLAST